MFDSRGDWRPGQVLGGLAAVSTAIMVIAWRTLQSEAAEYVVAGVSMVSGVVAVCLAWMALQTVGRPVGTTLEAMADRIAVAVRGRWEAEVQLRRVNDPYTIPVTWEPADPDLVPDWSSLEWAACSTGWPEPDRSHWASGPATLANGGQDLAGVLSRVPTSRLVVLGEPGAGKTISAIRLVLDLLNRRVPGGPVPVLVSLASWNPARERLWDWLERRLCLDHPALRARAPERSGVNWARALWDAGLFLPVLDGLDEVAGPALGRAIAGLNDALRPGVGMVLTARTDSYRQAVIAGPGGVQLSAAAGIQLCPLDAGVVTQYLRASAGGPIGQARWARVLETLRDPTHLLGLTLTTPLMASLARTVYSPRPGELTVDLPNPEDLLATELESRDAIERHLFDGFLSAAYRTHPDPALRCPWRPADARRWLVFLAGHLEHNLRGTTDLAWWQLRSAAPRSLTGVVAGVATAVGASLLFGLLLGPETGLVFGLACGLAFVIPARFVVPPSRPAHGLRWSPTPGGLVAGLTAGAVVGVVAGLTAGLTVGLTAGLVGGAGLGLAAGFAVGLVTGLGPRPVDPAETTDQYVVMSRDRSAFRNLVLIFTFAAGGVGRLAGGLADGSAAESAGGIEVQLATGLAVGLALGLAVGSVASLSAALSGGFVAALAGGLAGGLVPGSTYQILPWLQGGVTAGLVAGLAAGLAAGISQTAWGWYAAARCWLALRNRLPWRLMSFLADAHHQRGVLRQAGAAYQFRHAELQRHLAAQAVSKGLVSPASAFARRFQGRRVRRQES